jgi:hypothetical protein
MPIIFKKCPLCGCDSMKIISYGFPMNFCENEICNCMFGYFGFLVDRLPFYGDIFVYEYGYLNGLLKWLISKLWINNGD